MYAMRWLVIAAIGCDAFYGLQHSDLDAQVADTAIAHIDLVRKVDVAGPLGLSQVTAALPDSQAGDTIIVVVATLQSTLGTLSDSAGDSYTPTRVAPVSTLSMTSLYIESSIAPGGPVTLTADAIPLGANQVAISIAAFEFSEVGAADTGVSQRGTSTMEMSGPLATTATGEVLYFAASTHSDGFSATTIDSSLIPLDDIGLQGQTTAPITAGYRVGPAATDTSVTFTIQSILNWGIGLVTFTHR
jgi:hypothetical protein